MLREHRDGTMAYVRQVDAVIRAPVAPGATATILIEGSQWTPEICRKLCAYLELLESALSEDEQRETTAAAEGGA